MLQLKQNESLLKKLSFPSKQLLLIATSQFT